MAERDKEAGGAGERPTLLKRLAGNAQSIAAILAVVVSAVNVWFIFIDRERQARREVYQQQIEMTKFYFERVAKLGPEEWCDQAPLFAQASAIMAGYEPQSLRLRNVAASAAAQRRADAGGPAAPDPGQGAIDRERGVEALAATIVAAIDARAASSRDCDARVEAGQDGTPRARSGGAFAANSYAVAAAVAAAGVVPPGPAQPAPPAPAPAPAPTPAQVQQQQQALQQQQAQAEAARPRPAELQPPVGPRMTVYIQYPDGAEGRARELRERITRELAAGYTAPGAEKVRQAPSRDQVRIYRDADEARGRALADTLGLKDAQVVNLSRSYRDLPANTLELWLKAP